PTGQQQDSRARSTPRTFWYYTDSCGRASRLFSLGDYASAHVCMVAGMARCGNVQKGFFFTVTPGVAGSSPVSHPIQLDGLACTGYTAPPSAADRYGSVAQLAEQWTLNP